MTTEQNQSAALNAANTDGRVTDPAADDKNKKPGGTVTTDGTPLSLSTKAITDEMMALSALRRMAGGSSRPLLTVDALPGLRVVIRRVFAETALLLGNLVKTSKIDEADKEAAKPYDDGAALTLSLTLADGLRTAGDEAIPAGMLTVVRRQIEHAVAAGVLAWVAGEPDTEFARTLESQRRAALAAIYATLAEPGPKRMEGWPRLR